MKLRSGNWGRLLVRIKGTQKWGSVCADLFDYNDANVVCRQMGKGDGYKFYNKKLGHKTWGHKVSYKVSILLSDLNCRGNEASLSLCAAGRSNCPNGEVVFMNCAPKPTKPNGVKK